MSDRYPPIADYALLADCHSAALVSRAGSIDWACLRRFDAASSFGRILDWDDGGFFALLARDEVERTRRYLDDSLVVETTVRTENGSARVLDCFAMRQGGTAAPYHQLLRVVEGLDGTVTFDADIAPRFDYGELRPWLRGHASTGAYTAVGGDTALIISSPCELQVNDEHDWLRGALTVEAGERCGFAVEARMAHVLTAEVCPQDEVLRRLDETIAWWRRWSGNTATGERYTREIRRSAAVLKGLTCAPTGAIVAAPTTSLPETLGGERNWDYRYTWIRDATLTLAALSVAGHPEVARGFRDYLMRTAAGSAADLQIMYGIYGQRHLPEYTVDLDGYRGSRPVRVGNAAYRQVQHDMYGQILDAADLWRRAPSEEERKEIDVDEWRFLRQVVERAIAVWDEPDRGIWEIRGEPQHFVHSKVMLWVALDRGIRTVEETDLGNVDLERWRGVRDAIRHAIDTKGVHPEHGYFVQTFGSTQLDASLLQLPMVGFVPADDERMVATVDAIMRELAVPPEGFLLRYRVDETDDGLAGEEATFLMCSFWLVDVLAMQGRVAEATELFEKLLAVGNDLGLFAEEYDASTGQLLGNFPQAFTHLALINSAHQLACAAEGHCRTQPWDTAERMHERRL
jgi:GH15 family glucan-1,4-alpha-glucosidase